MVSAVYTFGSKAHPLVILIDVKGTSNSVSCGIDLAAPSEL